jgi:transketolase
MCSDNSREKTIASIADACVKLRTAIVEMLAEAGSGHPGGSLSAIDLIATLYQYKLRHDPRNPGWEGRDRFLLSKGHAAPALYAILAHHGYFDPELLKTLRKLGSPLQGHPVLGTVPGIEASTGSLGQGLSMAQGMALGARLDGSDARVYCMMGDGENQEGQVWEAAMSAGKWGLDNLVGIIDRNQLQIDGCTEEVMPLEPLGDKWQAFGWNVRRIDGHDIGAIMDAYDWADAREERPKLIIADTVKGKGCSLFEGVVKWHGTAPSKEEACQAVAEITGKGGKP